MKKILLGVLVVAVSLTFVSSQVFAYKRASKKAVKIETPAEAAAPTETTAAEVAQETQAPPPKFPEKGWHKGAYLGLNVGLVQVSNDKHIITDRQFGSWQNLGYGITFGWDIADWIGPMLQMNFSTKTAEVGDAGNAVAKTYPSQPAYQFDANTFPIQQARQYQADIGIYAKATLPYFTRASWQPKMVKILPYAKLGAAGSAVYVNASATYDKSGAFGGGPALGVGCEFLIWKGFFAALDFTEYLIFQKSISKTISVQPAGGGTATNVSFKLTEGGFRPHFGLMGVFGWHF